MIKIIYISPIPVYFYLYVSSQNKRKDSFNHIYIKKSINRKQGG